MEIDRRAFLSLSAGALLLPRARTAWAGGDAMFLAARAVSGHFEVAVIDERGRDLLVVPVEARGHAFAIDARARRAVAFARAPGRFAVGFDLDGRRVPHALAAEPGRHFFGHGVYASDSRLLLANENDFEGARGVVGLYDATDGYRRIGEMPSGGIGPHDIVLLGDGRTACIANGGILTHPDYDGIKLNLDAMAPSLVYLDTETGEISEVVALPPSLHRLSIRHLALDAFGAVWFGCQYEGDGEERPPLVGRHRRGRQPELFAGNEPTLRAMRNYVGAVAVDATGTIVATSSPLGGIVVFWDAATGACLGHKPLADGCGVAPLGAGTVLASSGRGIVTALGPRNDKDAPRLQADAAWDNHLMRVGT